MKINRLLTIQVLILLLLSMCVMAVTQSGFSDGTSTGNMTFTAGMSIYKNISIPYWASLTKAEIDLKGYNVTTTYPNLTIKSYNHITYHNFTFNGTVQNIDLNKTSLQQCINAQENKVPDNNILQNNNSDDDAGGYGSDWSIMPAYDFTVINSGYLTLTLKLYRANSDYTQLCPYYNILIYDDNANSPNNVIASTQIYMPGLENVGSATINNYTFFNTTVLAGQTYWVSFLPINSSCTTVASLYFGYKTTNPTVSRRQSANQGTTWTTDDTSSDLWHMVYTSNYYDISCQLNFTSTKAGILEYSNLDASYPEYQDYINIYVYDTNGDLVTSIEAEDNITSETQYTNPFRLTKANFTHNQSISLLLTDLNGESVTQSYIFNVNHQLYDYNITLNSNKLYISYSEKVDVIIQDSERVYNYTNTNYTYINQSDLAEGFVKVTFGRTGSSLDQTYEYMNDYKTNINDSLYVLSNTQTTHWLQVYDGSHSPISNAKVRLFQVSTNWTNITYKLTNQRLTTPQGLTTNNIDGNLYSLIDVSFPNTEQSNYIQKKINESNTQSNPDVITLITKYNQSYGYIWSMPSEFIDRNKIIYGNLYYYGSGTLSITTPYMPYKQILRKYTDVYWGGINYYQLTQANYIELLPGTHFNQSGDSNISIELYKDNTYVDTWTIEFKGNTSETDIADIGSQTFNVKILNPTLFVALILLCIITQFMVRNQPNTGMHTFFLGSILITLISSDFIILCIIAIVYYISQPLKKVMGVTE